MRDAFHPVARVHVRLDAAARLSKRRHGRGRGNVRKLLSPSPVWAPPCCRSAAIAAFTLDQRLGVRQGASTQNAFMLLKIAAIGGFVVVGLFAPSRSIRRRRTSRVRRRQRSRCHGACDGTGAFCVQRLADVEFHVGRTARTRQDAAARAHRRSGRRRRAVLRRQCRMPVRARHRRPRRYENARRRISPRSCSDRSDATR